MTPRRPISASFGMISIGNFEASSHSMTCGAISPSANSRMLRRSWFCSSVKEKSTVALAYRVACCRRAEISILSAAYSDTKFDLYILHEGIGGIGACDGASAVLDNDILAGMGWPKPAV